MPKETQIKRIIPPEFAHMPTATIRQKIADWANACEGEDLVAIALTAQAMSKFSSHTPEKPDRRDQAIQGYTELLYAIWGADAKEPECFISLAIPTGGVQVKGYSLKVEEGVLQTAAVFRYALKTLCAVISKGQADKLKGQHTGQLLASAIATARTQLPELEDEDADQFLQETARDFRTILTDLCEAEMEDQIPPLPYWKNEQGDLPAAVEKLFLEVEEPITEEERKLIASYLKIWLDYPLNVFPDERSQVELSQLLEEKVVNGNRSSILEWTALLQDACGMDPF